MQRLRFVVPRGVSRAPAVVLLSAALMLSGCKLFESTCSDDDRECLGGGELRSGKACVRNGDCMSGLDCIEHLCTYVASTQRNGACIVSAECAQGLYCSALDLQCRPLSEEPQGAGGKCATSADCERGLVCDADVAELFEEGPFGLLSQECQDAVESDDTPADCTLPRTCVARGKVDFGGFCGSSSDCLAGLWCVPDPVSRDKNMCFGGAVKLPIEPVSFPLWRGGACAEDVAAPVAYFDLPRASNEQNDFYRLPFPNDLRRDGDTIDLTGHPRPPETLSPQTATRYISESQTLSGFSTNPVVFFRFSQELRDSDLSLQTLRIVDITPGSPTYGRKESIAWSETGIHSNFVCPNWLGIHRPLGEPLLPKTTYAAIVTKGVRNKDNQVFERSADFDAMLSGSRPSDGTVASAWDVYAPLRDYLGDSSAERDFDAADLLNATVFTTQDAGAVVPLLRAAIEQEGPPALEDLTLCKEGVTSPCEDERGRGACHSERDSHAEIHGHVRLAAFQRGSAPYETPDEGGDIAIEGGRAVVQGHPAVCFALSVPSTPAPEGGYPLLIVAHPNGGSFADQMERGALAEWAAELPVPSAVLAIDMPVHGSRRNGATRPPQDLYFNLLNPKATRGNAVQGAADLISVALLATTTIARNDSPIERAISFDTSRVALFAHSQGATHAALMIGSEPRVRAAVLAGLGGNTSTSLLKQMKPADMSTVLPFVLFDPDLRTARLAADTANPMLALMQGYLDDADPINYARGLYLDVPSSAPDGHDVFMVYGTFDNFTTEESQTAYATAAGLSAVEPDLTQAFQTLPSPTRGNVMPGAQARTVALKTYDPRSDAIDDSLPQDGHFVAVATTPGISDVRRFLGEALQGDTPTIGGP